MASGLPGWVVDNVASVRDEAEPYRNASQEQILADLAAVCRAGTRILSLRDDVDAVVRHEDPLPESSVRILAELRMRASRRQPP
ncbi:MAG: hypothetical protein AB2A00_31790 [Myxococcota bacterium]